MTPTGCGLHKEKIRQPLRLHSILVAENSSLVLSLDQVELMLLCRRRECPTASGPWYLPGLLRAGFAKQALEASSWRAETSCTKASALQDSKAPSEGSDQQLLSPGPPKGRNLN